MFGLPTDMLLVVATVLVVSVNGNVIVTFLHFQFAYARCLCRQYELNLLFVK